MPAGDNFLKFNFSKSAAPPRALHRGGWAGGAKPAYIYAYARICLSAEAFLKKCNRRNIYDKAEFFKSRRPSAP